MHSIIDLELHYVYMLQEGKSEAYGAGHVIMSMALSFQFSDPGRMRQAPY